MKLEAQKEKLKWLTKFIRLGKLKKLQDHEDALQEATVGEAATLSGDASYKLDR